jgi:hypothetical protein
VARGANLRRQNLGLTDYHALGWAPIGHLIVSNGDAVNADSKQPSTIVEFMPAGKFVEQLSLDPNVDGAFGIALTTDGENSLRFVTVNDNTNTVSVWNFQVQASQHWAAS